MAKPKIILGIETSCDETAASIGIKTDDGVQVLSNVVASSLEIQAKYGGVVPEQAAREQLKSIIPVVEEALRQAQCKPPEINAIAITQGPGLIGSLLVGVETAKTLATVCDKPLIPVNHLVGHFYANWITDQQTANSLQTTARQKAVSRSQSAVNSPSFPALGLLVSGGHTDLIFMKDHGKYEYIGGTRDDAAGECFDKCARLLGLPYPGGPAISKLAKNGNPKAFSLPRPMIDSGDFDFSFSGLKTAMANIVHSSQFIVHSGNKKKESINHELITNNLAASIEAAIVDVLVKKTITAAKKYKVEQIIVAGGVAANQKLSETMARAAKLNSLSLFIPPPSLCTDNAAMIVSAAFYNPQAVDPLTLQANPSLSLSHN